MKIFVEQGTKGFVDDKFISTDLNKGNSKIYTSYLYYTYFLNAFDNVNHFVLFYKKNLCTYIYCYFCSTVFLKETVGK